MPDDTQVEDLIAAVCALDRAALQRQFVSHRASFPVDFTSEFLDSCPLERLQHIFVALCLQTKQTLDLRKAALA